MDIRRRTFHLPSGFEVTVTEGAYAPKGLIDAREIAVMEGYEGFAVWCDEELRLPPVLPSAKERHRPQTDFKKGVVKFYHRAFKKAKRQQDLQVIALNMTDKPGRTMTDLLVQALVTFRFTVITRMFSSLKSFMVIGDGSAYDNVLASFAAQLREIDQPRGIFRRLVKQQLCLEMNSTVHSDTPPSSLPHPSSSQLESVAGRSGHGDSGSGSRSGLARSPGTGSRLAVNASDGYFMRDFSQGSVIQAWSSPVLYQNANQWKAAHCRRRSREGNCQPGEVSGPETSDGVNPSAGGFGPRLWRAQYYFLRNKDFELQGAYIASGEPYSDLAGTQEYSPLITRCIHNQKVSGHRGNGVDRYITDRSPVGRREKCDRGTLIRSLQSRDRSDRKTSAEAGEAARGDHPKMTMESSTRMTMTTTESSTQMTMMTTAVSEARDDESSEDVDEECAICLSVFHRPAQLKKCGHVFCRRCLERAFQQRPCCPLCNGVIGVPSGNMPSGTMTIFGAPYHLAGYEAFTVIVLAYNIKRGIQQANHPRPGLLFKEARTLAFLPASPEGFMVCRLLWVAFQLRLTFTLGRSMTSDVENSIIWGGIDHKISMDDGWPDYGYPDPDYLRHVTSQLAEKGITEEFIQDFDIPF